MVESDDMLTDSDLDGIFAVARRQRADLPTDLRARILADADRVLPVVRHRPDPSTVLRGGGWARWLERLVWPTGLGLASAAGLAVGQSPALFERLLTAGVFESTLGYDVTYHLPVLAGLLGGY
ncbi:MAG: hypothetical protein ACK5IB_12095 [Qingshengfaniella sp.]